MTRHGKPWNQLRTVVILLTIVCGCKTQYARPVYDQPPKGEKVELAFPTVTPQVDENSVSVVRLPRPVAPHQILLIRGKVSDAKAAGGRPILIEVLGSNSQGEDVIAQTGIAPLTPHNDGSAAYHLELRPPEKEGKYRVTARIGSKSLNLVGRAELVVRGNRP
jgi:hypothetical protein